MTTVPIYPVVEFPSDPRLPELFKLFDSEWLWDAYQEEFGPSELVPQTFRIRQFTHSLGRRAMISYLVEWDPEEYLPSEHVVAKLERGQQIKLSRFPDDDSLPGLKKAADPEGALELLNRHILAVGARRARVEVVRYRPASRAVLRHRIGRAGFFVRVIPPDSLPPFLKGWELVGRSDFVAPRVAGHWKEGGVVWMSEIPGRNLRVSIRKGNGPDPEPLFKGLESLWALESERDCGTPYNLPGGYRHARRMFENVARENVETTIVLNEITDVLDSFIETWKPQGIAHNDFYDDQLIVTPDGRMALVDFEEAGPGDPLLDVGNFLAHLRWTIRFGSSEAA